MCRLIRWLSKFVRKKQIARDKIKIANDIAKIAKANEEKVLISAIGFLHNKQMAPVEIAKILEISTQKVSSIIRKLK